MTALEWGLLFEIGLVLWGTVKVYFYWERRKRLRIVGFLAARTKTWTEDKDKGVMVISLEGEKLVLTTGTTGIMGEILSTNGMKQPAKDETIMRILREMQISSVTMWAGLAGILLLSLIFYPLKLFLILGIIFCVILPILVIFDRLTNGPPVRGEDLIKSIIFWVIALILGVFYRLTTVSFTTESYGFFSWLWLLLKISLVFTVVLAVLVLITWIIRQFFPSLLQEVDRIITGIIIAVTSGVLTTSIIWYFFGSVETAGITGLIATILIHYLGKSQT